MYRTVLHLVPHNLHYLNKYIAFIEKCQSKNITNPPTITEKHHICPKSKDMWPQYASLKTNPWNCAKLTPRQHFVAHILLWKAFPSFVGPRYSLWSMKHKNKMKINSRLYATLKTEASQALSEIQRKRVANGTHVLLGGGIQRIEAQRQVENGTNIWQRDPSLPSKISKERVINGTHQFLDFEYQSKHSKETQRKRIEDGTHHLLATVSCIDKNGNTVRVPKDTYFAQKDTPDPEFVHFRTKEGKRRIHSLTSVPSSCIIR